MTNKLTSSLVFGFLIFASSGFTYAAVDSSSNAIKKADYDLFSKHKWHAIAPSWPGTLTFDSSTKKVTLAPLSASPLVSQYEYKVTSKNAKEKTVEGTMLFTLSADKKSEMSFKLVKDNALFLKFKGTQKEEKYQRMSPEEVAKYEDELRKLLKVNPAGFPVP